MYTRQYIGVIFDERFGKYKSYLPFQRRYLGIHKLAADAAKAHDVSLALHFKENPSNVHDVHDSIIDNNDDNENNNNSIKIKSSKLNFHSEEDYLKARAEELLFRAMLDLDYDAIVNENRWLNNGISSNQFFLNRRRTRNIDKVCEKLISTREQNDKMPKADNGVHISCEERTTLSKKNSKHIARSNRSLKRMIQSSEFKGVYYRKACQKYFAYFENKVNQSQYYIGSYDLAADAAKAYDEYSKHHGDGTECLNFDTTSAYASYRNKELTNRHIRNETSVSVFSSVGVDIDHSSSIIPLSVGSETFDDQSSMFRLTNGTRAEHCYEGRWYRGYVDCADNVNRVCRFVYDIDSSHTDGISFDELRPVTRGISGVCGRGNGDVM